MILFRWIRRLFLLLLIALVVIPGYVAIQVIRASHQVTLAKSDAIVVLGAAQFNGRPTKTLQNRIDAATSAYRRGLSKRIITVGAGAKGDHFTEAQSSFRALRSVNIPGNRIHQISIGSDTWTSTVAYVALMKKQNWQSVIIATDPFHCFRATAMAHDLGVRAVCTPDSAHSSVFRSTSLRYILRETGAYLAYKTFGRFGVHLSDRVKM